MSYRQAKIDLETWFAANWSHTPIVWENMPYDGSDEAWVRFKILNGSARQMSMGDNPAFRAFGFVVLQIFVQPDSGSGRALELADYAEVLFRNASVGDVRFRVSDVNDVGRDDAWYQVNVSTEFYRGF